MNEKFKIIALFGPSGSGKDTILKWLVDNKDIHKIISHTTRPPRDYEKNGVDYYFCSKDEFDEVLETYQFFEISTFNNWSYGTTYSALDLNKINIGIFTPKVISSYLLENKYFEVLPIFIDCNAKTRILRNLNREEEPDCYEICRRYLKDIKDFYCIDFDYIIYNNNRNDAEFFNILNILEVKKFMDKNI